MTISKNENIQELLKLFGYSGEALEQFKNELNKEIAKEYEIVEEDGRLIKKIGLEEREIMDEGWKSFKSTFNDFVIANDISYVDFITNSITIDKQRKKLFKTIITLYKKKFPNIEKTLEEIISCSFSKSRRLPNVFNKKSLDVLFEYGRRGILAVFIWLSIR
jgi:hypothetical protein